MNHSKKRLAGPLLGLAGIGLAAGWYASQIEPRWLRITRLALSLPDLPPAFDGYRIVHFSDLHLGVGIANQQLPDIVQAVNREQPDLIAITGDFLTNRRDEPADAGQVLAQLRAPDGVWGVLGNHDHRAGVDITAALLHTAGIELLCNRHHTLTHGADRLVIAGVDDMVRGISDLPAALDGAPDGVPVILLAHEPDFARIALAEPRIRLQLSGHTHGGQVRLPWWGPPILPKFGQLYPAGAYWVRHFSLYVTHGTGTGRFVLRFNCRPEIVVITLVRGESDPAGWGKLAPVDKLGYASDD